MLSESKSVPELFNSLANGGWKVRPERRLWMARRAMGCDERSLFLVRLVSTISFRSLSWYMEPDFLVFLGGGTPYVGSVESSELIWRVSGSLARLLKGLL